MSKSRILNSRTKNEFQLGLKALQKFESFNLTAISFFSKVPLYWLWYMASAWLWVTLFLFILDISNKLFGSMVKTFHFCCCKWRLCVLFKSLICFSLWMLKFLNTPILLFPLRPLFRWAHGTISKTAWTF